MSKVFISYSAQDMPMARALVDKLRSVDVTGWMDASDVSSGTAISSAIRHALQSSSAVVVLLSPAALSSKWVNFEVGAAEALAKPIIPVLLGGENIEDQLPDIFKQRRWLDARNRSMEQVADDIERALE